MESLDYPERFRVFEDFPKHDGMIFELVRKWICTRPGWGNVVVIDKGLLVLSFEEKLGREH